MTNDPIRAAIAAAINPEHQGEDRQILHVFYDACMSEGGSADEIHLRGLRAVLARWGHQPTPLAEGEVAEIAAWVRAYSDCEFGPHSEDPDHRGLYRAAELLQQQHPTPVPVSDEPWKREGWCDENGWCWFGCHGEVWMFCHPNEREISSVSLPAGALPVPLPQGGVE